MKKRILSFFLALVMLFSCFSLNIFATEGQAAVAENAIGTVIESTLADHTDAQIAAEIAALTEGRIAYHNGITTAENSKGGVTNKGKQARLENGKLVIGVATEFETVSGVYRAKEAYIQYSSNASGRSAILTAASSYRADNGKAFVAQVEITPYQHYLDMLGEQQATVMQLSTYADNSGYSSSLYRPKAQQTNYILISGTSLFARDASDKKVKPIADIKANETYTISMHVNPQDIDAAAGIYGSFDVYVNGVCVAKRFGFCTSTENNQLVMPENRPYFVDGDAVYPVWSGTTLLKPKEQTAYFFSDEFDVTIDADKNGVWDVYQNVPGITAESGYPVAKFIGTMKGVQDYAIGFMRILHTTTIFTEDAYAVDNLAVYYQDEYKGTVVDHRFTSAHNHDFSKATTNVTYTCEICEGKKVVAEAIDANGDRVCDLCVADLPLGGAITNNELIDTVGAADVIFAGDMSGITVRNDKDTGQTTNILGVNNGKSQFVISNPWGNISFVTEGGNTYIKHGISQNKEAAFDDTNYFQVQDTVTKSQAKLRTLIQENSPIVGASYVISYEFLHYGNIEDVELLEISSYLAPDGAKSKTVAINPLRLYQGNLWCYHGTKGWVDTGVALNANTYYTLTFAHEPSTNTYDAYVNNEIVAKDFVALKKDKITAGTWEMEDGTKVEAVKHFTPAFVRFRPTLRQIDYDAIAVDNIKIYRASTNVECVHKFELSHTHNLETSTNKVKYTCDGCGMVKEYELAMSDVTRFNGTGKVYTPAEIVNMVNEPVLAADFSNSKRENLVPGEHEISIGGDQTTAIQLADGYLKFAADEKKCDDENKSNPNYDAYVQYYFDKGLNTTRFSAPFENFEDLRGDTYTVSLSFRIDNAEEFTDVRPIQFLSYLSFLSESDFASKTFKAQFFEPIKVVNENGVITLRVGNSSKYTTVMTLEEDVWYNITVHFTPAGDETSPENTYDAYVDGNLVAKNKQALTSDQDRYMTWETTAETSWANGKIVKSNGAEDCIPTAVRFAQYYAAGEKFSLDNLVIYKNQICLNCNHSFNTTGVCDWCGIIADDTQCDICDGLAISDEVAITGVSVTLDELIDLNFYAKINEELLNKEGEVATVTCGDDVVTLALKDAENTEFGYKFSIPLLSTEMTKEVTLEIDGATYTSSVEEYACTLIALDILPEATDAAIALLNYGAAAQTYFAKKHNNPAIAERLANANLTEDEKTVAALTEQELAAHAFAQSGATGAVRFTGAKLVMASKVEMKLYFTAPEGATVTVDGETAYAVKDDGEYYISFTAETPINAMTDEITVAVTYGTTASTTTVNVFTAVAAGINGTNADLSDMLTAYAQYCKAAAEFAACQ